MVRRGSWARRVLCGAAALVLPLTAGSAHELGTTRVSALLPADGGYVIEVATDARALLDKLESASDIPAERMEALVSDQLERRLRLLEPVFLRRVVVAIDGRPVTPTHVSWTLTQPTGTGASEIATIRLAGDVPALAKQLTWRYGWTFTAYAFTVRDGEAQGNTEWLEGNQISAPAPLHAAVIQDSRIQLVARYVFLGFSHILPNGLDHVLFVLGIFFLSRRMRPILLQVTAFTAAHSITLALSIYGLVALPSAIVEPAIALSIAYIAIENLTTATVKPRRYALVFGFGLLHGLGFAGVLKEIGLPRADYLTALIGFNVGVESGQLSVIAAAFLTIGHPFGDRAWYRRRVVLPACTGIALLGIYWTVVRLHMV